ncbi:guanine nucleotide-binding protein alpha-4 subunit [Mycena pura]|uniref:Guanine nucleotide-binding protein alpha-4 subunit n=1 Tax=Mycena pura TaxID=153505 RepID=A0AAD6Y9Y4_9AGAR|nr:guanine nucleotide-binding protein alpha-4 subunit [Mycena pura]
MSPSNDPLDAVLRPPPDETYEEAALRETREEQARCVSAAIDAEIKAERLARRKKRIVRLLLLGQSESGKSTTLRQFQRLYTPTAFREERVLWRAVIQLNIVRSIRTILETLSPEQAAASPRPRRPSVAPSAVMLLNGNGTTMSADITDPNNPYDSYTEFAPAVDSDPDSDPEQHVYGPSSSRFAVNVPPGGGGGGAFDALRTALLPLRLVEAHLIARLVSPNEKEPTHLPGMPDTFSVTLNSREIFVRPGNRWKGGARGKSPERDLGTRGDRDEAQEVLHACAPAMLALWNDPGVREVLRRRKIRLEEGPGFFLDDLERVTLPNYLPTDDDVLRARLKTVGVSEYTFSMEVSTGRETPTEWRIIDVGGSRSQVLAFFSTWVPFFDDVDAIIFLAPIAGFDQVLAEDRTVNRLEDSVLLWKSVCSNKLLAGVDLVLFLNKCDILEKKLEAGIKIVRYVRNYADRENTFQAVSQYLRGKFSAIHREYSPNPRKFYAFCTSVTDTATTGGIIASGEQR